MFLHVGPLWGLKGADFTFELCLRVTCVIRGKSFPLSGPQWPGPQKASFLIALFRGLNEILLYAEGPRSVRRIIGIQLKLIELPSYPAPFQLRHTDGMEHCHSHSAVGMVFVPEVYLLLRLG